MTDKTAPRPLWWNAEIQKLVDALVSRIGSRMGTEETRRAFAGGFLGIASVLSAGGARQRHRADSEHFLSRARASLRATRELATCIDTSPLLASRLYERVVRRVRGEDPLTPSRSPLDQELALLSELVFEAEAEVARAPTVLRGPQTTQALLLATWAALSYRRHFGEMPGTTNSDPDGTVFLKIFLWLKEVRATSGSGVRISTRVVRKGIQDAEERIRPADERLKRDAALAEKLRVRRDADAAASLTAATSTRTRQARERRIARETEAASAEALKELRRSTSRFEMAIESAMRALVRECIPGDRRSGPTILGPRE